MTAMPRHFRQPYVTYEDFLCDRAIEADRLRDEDIPVLVDDECPVCLKPTTAYMPCPTCVDFPVDDAYPARSIGDLR